MIIELLKFNVPPEKWEAFIQRDEAVWTAGLKQFPGFLGKEVWVEPGQNVVIMVIRWESQAQWDAVPPEKIAELDRNMGELGMPISESSVYQVRKFLH